MYFASMSRGAIDEVAHMRVHWYPGTCARAVLVTLEEIGLPYEPRLLLRTDPDVMTRYKAEVNPKGKVPVLQTGTQTITEIPIIQTFLAQRHPEARLLPADPDESVEALSLMCYMASGIHPLIARIRFPTVATDDAASHERIRAVAKDQLADAFALFEKRLGAGQWLFKEWCVADAYLQWCWFRGVGSGIDPGPYPHLADFHRRSEARPSLERVIELEETTWEKLVAEGATPPAGMPMATMVGRLET
jgi:glutathione S-transferase